jgi:hypothetical protein
MIDDSYEKIRPPFKDSVVPGFSQDKNSDVRLDYGKPGPEELLRDELTDSIMRKIALEAELAEIDVARGEKLAQIEAESARIEELDLQRRMLIGGSVLSGRSLLFEAGRLNQLNPSGSNILRLGEPPINGKELTLRGILDSEIDSINRHFPKA